MHRTIEAIIYPNGTIEALEPIAISGRRRALLTILDEAPLAEPPLALPSDAERLAAALRAAGLHDDVDDIPADVQMLTDDELDALWARNPTGTPLSQIIIEDREERF